MSNRRNIQFTYNPHNKATLLDCSFVVDSTNGNGQGIRSLKNSGRIASVFMNSSPAATTATSVFASGVTLLTLSSVTNIVVGEVITDSTTGGNITGGTTVAAVYPATSQILLSLPTAGASAVSPGDTLSFAMTPALVGNPNPQAGVIIVNLQDNYNRYLSGFGGNVVPLSGSSISSGLSVGNIYVIVNLGTTTTAQWNTAGVPLNIVPAVGVAFIAATTSFPGTGRVQAPAAAGTGIFNINGIGDANLANSNGANVLGAGQGMQIMLGCYKDSAADAPVLAAPADNSVISLVFYMNDSAQGV